ncbi:F-box domain-containing protein [Colletotrichum salicis]|uniref:F-box domain-containing protein n=1 Tax=Colletotrichum salicis TaxID=1209931 RepID=A0A135S5U3_9PEZI|nr:F-box domain-containing protein [Colletotrichum salicis]
MEHAGDQRGILAEQFTKLTNDDGSPNTALRHANLDNLVSRLTPWEFLYLKQLTRRSSFKLAEMHNLPEELVAVISRHLRLGDAVKCTQVSKAWRQKWTSHTVVSEIARVSFPGLAAAFPGAMAWDVLRPVSQKATARNEGKLTSWLYINTADKPLLECTALKYDDRSLEFIKSNPKPTPSGFFKNDSESRTHLGFAYCSGKVAWQWDSYRFFIDDIRAKTRKLVSLPDLVVKGDKDLIVYTMTENLLILADQFSMMALIIYDLDKDQYRRVTLPKHMTDLQAHKDMFVVNFTVDYYGDEQGKFTSPPHFWNWSTGLVKLDVPGSTAAEERRGYGYSWSEHRDEGADSNNGLIFHPTKPHIFYFVSVYFGSLGPSYEGCESDSPVDEYEANARPRRCLVLVEVHKFENTKFVKTFTYKSIRRCELEDTPRFTTHCRPMNSYGLYNIGTMYKSLSKQIVIVNSAMPGKKTVETPSFFLRIIKFDTTTEIFRVEKKVLWGMRRPIWEPATCNPVQAGGVLWNDSVIYLQNKTPRLNGNNKPQWRHDFKGNGQRAICIANNSMTVVLETNKPWFKESGEFRSIAVDDDFVVGLSRRGYVVYNFGDPSLNGGPWTGRHQVRRYHARDTECPVSGCPGPTEFTRCQICGSTPW